MTDKTKILIVEQNIPAAMRMVYLLTCAGCDVQVAPTGQGGMHLAQESRFDLIMLEADLPDASGFEICRKLKRDLPSCHSSVVFVSSRSNEQYIRQGAELGAADYIVTPFEPTDFIFRIISQAKARNCPKEL